MNDKEFLIELKKYIENMEEAVDGEWGICRSIEEIIAAEAMPNIYYDVLQRISIIKGDLR
jgi:hypothetical protein